MNPGKLNEQVTAYSYVVTSDNSGGKRSKESVSFTDWAFVKRLSSSRTAEDSRMKRLSRYEVTMRSRLDWSNSVDGADFSKDVFKIVYRGRDLVISGPPMESEDRSMVTFECIERQSAG